jgi:hypothetical protein
MDHGLHQDPELVGTSIAFLPYFVGGDDGGGVGSGSYVSELVDLVRHGGFFSVS